MSTIAELLRGAGIELADARALLRAVLDVSDAHLVASPGRVLTVDEFNRFAALATRRRAGEPVAYLIGTREFYSLAFKVTPAVLIPRPETELLVEAVLESIPLDTPADVLDLATGSGCVAIAIAKHRPRAHVTATDVSPSALAVARENARTHAVEVEFVESNWLAALGGRRFDWIVANPPYIAEGDPHLLQGDVRFEPRGALVAGLNGLEGTKVIIEGAVNFLRPGGRLLLEHGHDQGGRSRDLLGSAGYQDIVTLRDLAGVERASGGRV
jgi:release factor glutamine methyltransferase